MDSNDRSFNIGNNDIQNSTFFNKSLLKKVNIKDQLTKIKERTQLTNKGIKLHALRNLDLPRNNTDINKSDNNINLPEIKENLEKPKIKQKYTLSSTPSKNRNYQSHEKLNMLYQQNTLWEKIQSEKILLPYQKSETNILKSRNKDETIKMIESSKFYPDYMETDAFGNCDHLITVVENEPNFGISFNKSYINTNANLDNNEARSNFNNKIYSFKKNMRQRTPFNDVKMSEFMKQSTMNEKYNGQTGGVENDHQNKDRYDTNINPPKKLNEELKRISRGITNPGFETNNKMNNPKFIIKYNKLNRSIIDTVKNNVIEDDSKYNNTNFGSVGRKKISPIKLRKNDTILNNNILFNMSFDPGNNKNSNNNSSFISNNLIFNNNISFEINTNKKDDTKTQLTKPSNKSLLQVSFTLNKEDNFLKKKNKYLEVNNENKITILSKDNNNNNVISSLNKLMPKNSKAEYSLNINVHDSDSDTAKVTNPNKNNLVLSPLNSSANNKSLTFKKRTINFSNNLLYDTSNADSIHYTSKEVPTTNETQDQNLESIEDLHFEFLKIYLKSKKLLKRQENLVFRNSDKFSTVMQMDETDIDN